MRQRILATSNVAQLTGVMKLVAASKLKGVETRLMAGRPFGEGLMNSVSFKIEVDPEHPDYNHDVATTEPKKVMFMVVTTDRGLCGGVNSQIIRAARTEYKRYTDAGHDCSVRDSPACQRCGCVRGARPSSAYLCFGRQMFVLGEKGRSGLFRTHANSLVRVVDNAFDKDVTFNLAAAIAGYAVEEDFNEMIMLYNHYENPARFAVTCRSFPKISGLRTLSLFVHSRHSCLCRGCGPHAWLSACCVWPPLTGHDVIGLRACFHRNSRGPSPRHLPQLGGRARGQRGGLGEHGGVRYGRLPVRRPARVAVLRNGVADDCHGQCYQQRHGDGGALHVVVQPRSPGKDYHGACGDYLRRRVAQLWHGGGLSCGNRCSVVWSCCSLVFGARGKRWPRVAGVCSCECEALRHRSLVFIMLCCGECSVDGHLVFLHGWAGCDMPFAAASVAAMHSVIGRAWERVESNTRSFDFRLLNLLHSLKLVCHRPPRFRCVLFPLRCQFICCVLLCEHSCHI